MTRDARLFVGGRWVDGDSRQQVLDKYSGEEIATLHLAGPEQVDAALRGVRDAQLATDFRPYDRFTVLSRASQLLAERAESFVETIVDDAGFTIADARREVERATQTLLLSAEEAKRIHGEVIPLDGAPGAGGRIAFTVRHPLGVVCAITPFNSPLNTVAHKVGPALAAGNAVILKPSSLTPLTAVALVELLLDAGLPDGLISIVHGGGSTVGQQLLDDKIPAFYAFTGSTPVGEQIRRSVGLRRTQLELGSLSSTIVCDDAALPRAAQACVGAAFRKAGQVCTSVQRLYVHRAVRDEFAALLAEELNQRSWGDPRADGAFVGPVISAGEAERVQSWVDDAVSDGARVVAGGQRDKTVVVPTVLSQTTSAMRVMSEEVFGPVVSLVDFDDLEMAIAEINDTPYGLAAGIFTADIDRALTAAETLRMGSVHINETSSSRVDLMPYGGVKASGTGVEGPKYAIEEMTEQRLVTIGRP